MIFQDMTQGYSLLSRNVTRGIGISRTYSSSAVLWLSLGTQHLPRSVHPSEMVEHVPENFVEADFLWLYRYGFSNSTCRFTNLSILTVCPRNIIFQCRNTCIGCDVGRLL